MALNKYLGIECFKKGPHERDGHDYSLENSVHGGICSTFVLPHINFQIIGSCDCGNEHAWKPEGACVDHCTENNPTPANEDPASPLPKDVRIINNFYCNQFFE